jgi:hypothetical protein
MANRLTNNPKIADGLRLSLTDFCLEQQEKLILFRQWWIQGHEKDPEIFPMTMADGNEGLWMDMFHNFLTY